MARLLNGAYQVNNGGNWQAAAKTLYDQAVASPFSTTTTAQAGTWTVTLSSQYGFPATQISAVVSSASAAVVSVTPDLDAELKGGILATFYVGPEAQPLHVFVTNAATIDSLYKLQSGQSNATIPFGTLKPGPGAGFSNAPWSWHLDPADTIMAFAAQEVSAALPQYVEDNLADWINKKYGPWTAKLISIKDYR